MKARRSVLKMSFYLFALSVLAKSIGFFREIVVAHFFGATAFVDAYVGAFTLMHLCTIWMHSALYSGGIPFFICLLHQKGSKSLTSFINMLFFLLLGIGLLCATGALVFASQLSQLFFPGFSPKTQMLLVQIMRFLWVFGVFRVASFVLETYLQALDYQITVRIGWLLQSLVLLVVLASGFSFWGGFAWPLGQSVGQVATVLFLLGICLFAIPGDKRLFRSFAPSGEGCWGEFLRKTLPVVLTNAQYFLYQMVDRYFASLLAVGSMACMNYATVLWGLTALLNEPLAPLLTRFSVNYAKGDAPAFRQDMEKALRATLWLFVTLTVGYVVLLPDVVDLVFVHGKFTAHDAVRTWQGARILAFQAPAVCLGSIFGQMVLASGASHVSMAFSAVTLTLNGFLDWLLVDSWGLNGLLFATTAATYVGVLLGYLYIRRKFTWSVRQIQGYLFKLFFWGSLTGLAGLGVRHILPFGSLVAAGITTLCLFSVGYLLYRLFALRSEIPVGWAPEDIVTRIWVPLMQRLRPGGRN